MICSDLFYAGCTHILLITEKQFPRDAVIIMSRSVFDCCLNFSENGLNI